MRRRVDLLLVTPILLADPAMHVGATRDLALELLLTVGELDLALAEDKVADAFDVRIEELGLVEIEGEVGASFKESLSTDNESAWNGHLSSLLDSPLRDSWIDRGLLGVGDHCL